MKICDKCANRSFVEIRSSLPDLVPTDYCSDCYREFCKLIRKFNKGDLK